MLEAGSFYRLLARNGLDFFTGVPDSLLKNFLAYVNDHADRHIIAANEGNAIALAAGYHLATGRSSVVYMQNSGLGNSVNPLTSLADKDVYRIPMLLIVGWRGRPGEKDEPQHVTQGRITRGLLKTLGIPSAVLPASPQGARAAVQKAVKAMKRNGAPYALVVKTGTFESYQPKNAPSKGLNLDRERAIKSVVERLPATAIVISSTGMISRELFETREGLRQRHDGDFLTVGSMGHSSQIALAAALARPKRDIYCFDGDGALLMHMGALAIIGSLKPANFRHIVFNNGAHDSVGGQPTCGFDIDIPAIAEGCGYRKAYRAQSLADTVKKAGLLRNTKGPVLLEIRVTKGARKDLGRPTISTLDAKIAFMRFLAMK